MKLHQIQLDDLTPTELELAGETFAELLTTVSVPEALALCRLFGGLELSIPAPEESGNRAGPQWVETVMRGRLRDVLSGPSYHAFLKRFAGTCVYFPSLERLRKARRDKLLQRRADELYRRKTLRSAKGEGDTLRTELATVLALEFGVSRSYCYRILKKDLSHVA